MKNDARGIQKWENRQALQKWAKEAKSEPKGSQKAPEGNQKGAIPSQKVAQISKSCSNIKPWGVRHFSFFALSLFVEVVKAGAAHL